MAPSRTFRHQDLPFAVFLIFILLVIQSQISGSFAGAPDPIVTIIAPSTVTIIDKIFFKVSATVDRPVAAANTAAAPDKYGSASAVSIIEIIVNDHNYTELFKTTKSLEMGSAEEIPISIPESNITRSAEHLQLLVKASKKHGNGSSSVFFQDSSQLAIRRRKTTIIFMHTDKPIYKPGETVRFRVLALDSRDLTPLPTPLAVVDISLLDSRQNVIKSWRNQSVENGLFSDSVALSGEPNLGDWSLKVTAKNEHGDITTDKQLSFSVDEYILPKFNVELIISPSFVTFDDSKVTVLVKAEYTYGDKVKGEVILSIHEEESTHRYYHGYRAPAVTKHMTIDGTAAFEIDLAQELDLVAEHSGSTTSVSFSASVIEATAGRVLNSTAYATSIQIYAQPYKFTLLAGSGNYKPGLPFLVSVKVTTQDDTPVIDDNPEALAISHEFSYTEEGSVRKSAIPATATGVVDFVFQTPSNENIRVSGYTISYKTLSQRFEISDRAQSESRTYLQLKMVTSGPIRVGEECRVSVQSNRPFSSVNLQLFAGSEIYLLGKTIKSPPVQRTVVKFEIPAKIGAGGARSLSRSPPPLTLLAYIVHGTAGEIIADSLALDLGSNASGSGAAQLISANYLNVTLANSSLDPGQEAQLRLETKANSLIALRAVDQSVLLLKEDKDIDMKTVTSELNSANFQDFHSPHRDSSSYAGRIFSMAGLTILTNGKLTNNFGQIAAEDEEDIGAGGFAYPESLQQKEVSFSFEADLEGSDEQPPQESNVRVRKHFPETWLWEEISTTISSSSEDGSVTDLRRVVPDTLTSWIITGYSIHPQAGLGILNEAQKMMVSRPFFMTLHVPYSVVMGELVGVEVLVHNYLGAAGAGEVDVEVELHNKNHQFRFLEANDTSAASTARVGNQSTAAAAAAPLKKVNRLKSQAGHLSSTTFFIIPESLGAIELFVKGSTKFAGDALTQPLIVRPPGLKHTLNQVAFLELGTTSSSTHAGKAQVDLQLQFPENRLPGADSIKLSLISDILGPTITNLDNLLQLPLGCGEQNMVAFVPDIVVLNYLTTTQALTPAIRKKATGFLETGYQRELTYLHSDGSFSAFGQSDTHGSTWLTAFVLRSFALAKPYITIDEGVMSRGLQFLARRQSSKDGHFEELGQVIHSELKGAGATGAAAPELALTAYVLLTFALLDQDNATRSRYYHVQEKAISFLTSGQSANSTSPYALILTTYTLHVVGHPARGKFLENVEKLAKTKTGGQLKYWETNPPAAGARQAKSARASPVSVEMTSYALLTLLKANRTAAEVLPIVKWLLTQRNPEGGFTSTQDTVVGLLALGEFAQLTSAGGRKLNIDLHYQALSTAEEPTNETTVGKEGAGELKMAARAAKRHVKIDATNAIVLQQFELDNSTKSVHIMANGTGFVLAQLENSYYQLVERSETDKGDSFNIDVDVWTQSKKPKEMKLHICTNLNERHGSSNMVVLEINLPTGYSFDKQQLSTIKEAAAGASRYDLTASNSKLELYFNSLSWKTKLCVLLEAKLSFKVTRQTPPVVTVYDYYDPVGKRSAVSYQPPQLEFCDMLTTKKPKAGSNDCV